MQAENWQSNFAETLDDGLRCWVKSDAAYADTTMTMLLNFTRSESHLATKAMWTFPCLDTTHVASERGNAKALDRRYAG